MSKLYKTISNIDSVVVTNTGAHPSVVDEAPHLVSSFHGPLLIFCIASPYQPLSLSNCVHLFTGWYHISHTKANANESIGLSGPYRFCLLCRIVIELSVIFISFLSFFQDGIFGLVSRNSLSNLVCISLSPLVHRWLYLLFRHRQY